VTTYTKPARARASLSPWRRARTHERDDRRFGLCIRIPRVGEGGLLDDLRILENEPVHG